MKYLYTMPDRKMDFEQQLLLKTKEVANAFANVTQIPVSYVNNKDEMEWEVLPQGKMCGVFSKPCDCNESCLRILKSAASTAHKLGEAYLFVCNAGMIKIAYPFVCKKENCGCFFAGPFAMGSNREHVLRHISKKLGCRIDNEYKLIVFFSTLKVYSPKEVQYIYDLFQHSMLGAMRSDAEFGTVYINERKNKGPKEKEEGEVEYPTELERQLLDAVKGGNGEQAQLIFTEFFERIRLLEADNLGFVKIRLMELTGILSRVSGKNAIHTINSYNYLECLEELNHVMTYQSVFNLINNLIGRFANDAFLHMYEGNSEIIRNVLRYIEDHYKEDVTLNDVAGAVHINSSYLSSLFKNEMGIAFTYYLTELRIKKSLQLLVDTNLSLTEIALSVGFNSQSYFIKVFKDNIGMTPREYRKKSNNQGLYR